MEGVLQEAQKARRTDLKTVTIPADTWRRVSHLATDHDVSKTQMLDDLVRLGILAIEKPETTGSI